MDNQRCHAAALAEHLSRNSQRGSPSSPPLPLTPFSPCYLLPALTRKKEIQNLWLLWDEPAFTIAISFSPIFNFATHCQRQTKTSLRPPCALFVANQLCFATKGAQRGTKVFRVGAPPQTPDPECDPLTHKSVLMVSYRHAKSTRQILRHERRANRRSTRAGPQNRH